MKVIIINGQTHKGNTHKVTNLLIKNLHCKKDDIKEYYATDFPQCTGCAQCILNSEKSCPHHEHVSRITSAIDNADVIIMTSPNYCMGMTGQLKSLCDHMAFRWMSHRPVDMRNKIGVAVATTAGKGASKVTKQIAEQMMWWSVGKIYQIPFRVGAFSMEDIKEARLDKLSIKTNAVSKKINNNWSISKPSFKTKFYFNMMKTMQIKMPWSDIEVEYWKQQGFIK